MYALSQSGHKTYKASNGAEAIEIFKTNPKIEIVILDLRMPVMNGQGLCPVPKNLNPHIEIIVSSAFADETAIKELNALGVKHILHFRKP